KMERGKVSYGAFAVLNRLEDLPLAGDVPQHPQGAAGAVNSGLATLDKLGYSGSSNLGYWWGDPYGHLGGARNLPKTAEERAAWGKQGIGELDALVKKMDLPTVIQALRDHRKFTEQSVGKKFPTMIP